MIHGRSGVGKSSLVNAGLIPALKNTSLGARQPLPVVIHRYSAWVRELERSLATALLSELHLNSSERNLKKIWYQVIATASHHSNWGYRPAPDSLILHPSSFILQQLHKNAERNFLTVLIFDQFEEFFFASSNRHHRQQFYQALKIILDIPFVKVVFSLKEDYLHYLLEWDYGLELDAINNNILDKQIRYRLRDFSQSEAKLVIERLTQRAKFELEPALIDAIVKDLGDERQEVRPIELQVVGAQLQEENGQGITTLAEYQQLGANPKAELIRHSIEQVIQDCGPENEAAAWEVLFALTDENLTRSIRTKAELIKAIHPSQTVYNSFSETPPALPLSSGTETFIDIILESGLLLRRREEPEDRYQLLHDYLVSPIRQGYAILDKQRQQQIQNRLHQAEAEKQQVEATLEKMSQEQLLQRNRRLKLLLCLSLVVASLLGSAAKIAKYQQHRADQQKRLANLATLTASSDALFFSHYKFDALMEGLRAAKQLQGLKFSPLSRRELNNMETRIAATLQQSIYGISEKNRLEGHGDIVWDVSFSPQGNLIASGSVDKTIKLWTANGKLLKTFKGHQGSITSISFSPDGQLLASASQDGTIKLWNLGSASHSTLTFTGHQDIVSSVSFSPDGNLIASASEDQTIKLWRRNGVLVRSLPIDQASVNWISFNPQGNRLATANDDGTVRILDFNGNIIATLNHRKFGV